MVRVNPMINYNQYYHIDDIVLSSFCPNTNKVDKKEKYQRIKDFYPDALPYIRRYKKKHIKKLKLKKGKLWEPADWTDCEDYDKELI